MVNASMTACLISLTASSAFSAPQWTSENAASPLATSCQAWPDARPISDMPCPIAFSFSAIESMAFPVFAAAASTLSSNYVARSAPDGYTLYAAPVSIVINPVLQAKVEYDAQRDFAPISMMITSAFVLQANLDLKVKDLKELLALIRANPDKFAIGTSGMGSINHLAAEYFIKNFGLKMAVIHYKGGAPAATDLIGGRIHMMFSATNEALPLVSSGRTQGIAVSTAKRISSLPDLPTIDEASGTKGFDAVFWLALLAPAKTPAPVLKRLEAAMQVVGADQTLRDDLAKKGVDLYVSSPAEVQSYMQRDGSKWGEIIRQLGIKE